MTTLHDKFQTRTRVVAATAPTDAANTDAFTWAEIQRIVRMPVVRPMDEGECEEYSRLHVQADYFAKGFRLLHVQAEAVAAYELHRCLFGNIGVGGGKTLVSLMCAAKAFANGCDRILLMPPPEVYSQLVDVDIPWARARVVINYPIHYLGGRTLDYRRELCQSKRKGLYIMPHSLLSTKDTSENLLKLDPQMVIVDEVHRLSNHSAAKTRRYMSMVERAAAAGKPLSLVDLSGTITTKSINEYWHLMRHCLGDRSPLPLSPAIKNDWALLIDAGASSPDATPSPNGITPILPLVQWAKNNFPAQAHTFTEDVFGFRRAYKMRLHSTPGVVSSGDTSIGTSLIMHNLPVPAHETHPRFPALKVLCDKVEDMWLTPNDDEIEHAIHKWKWLHELSAGFYNELTWPVEDAYADRKKITIPEAHGLLEHARVHHAAGQEYAKQLRTFLEERSLPGMDTPFLVGLEMARNGAQNVPEELYRLWREWKDLTFPGMPERDSRAVRVCNYKIQAAVDWAKALRAEKGKTTGAIFWVYHKAVAVWLTEELKAAGMADAVNCPAGETYNELIRNPDNRHRFLVASIKAHGTGKNLQHFSEMYFMQWPRRAGDAEQVLGRMHRTGQTADEIVVATNHTLMFDEMNFAACLNDSLYIHQTTGNRQKLIYAAYDPLPRIFPHAILAQKGLETTRLDAEQEQALKDKFGKYAGGTPWP